MDARPFDDRDGFIWQDGEMLPWRDAKVHVLTHGLHYASSIFEGERAYGGRIFKLREHNQRLIRSGRLLGFEIPYAVEEIDRACEAVLAANGLEDAYVRPVAWRGSEAMGVGAHGCRVHLAVAAWVWPNLVGEARRHGIGLGMAQWRRPDPRTAPTESKAAGLYMIGMLAKHQAEAEGFDDALMLDWRDNLAEATSANLFLVIDGAVHTPKPEGFLDGITRRTVMDLARARGLQVIERHIPPEDLAQAREVFVTGTFAEVRPIHTIGERRYATPGPVTETLMNDYHDLAHGLSRSVAA